MVALQECDGVMAFPLVFFPLGKIYYTLTHAHAHTHLHTHMHTHTSPTSLVPAVCCFVASFPGRSHHQYLIACGMQIQREKAWEIWSCAEKERALRFFIGRVSTICLPESTACSRLDVRAFSRQTIATLGTDQHKTRIITLHHVSTLCLHVYLTSYLQAFPPPYQTIKYWRWEWPGNMASSLHSIYMQQKAGEEAGNEATHLSEWLCPHHTRAFLQVHPNRGGGRGSPP